LNAKKYTLPAHRFFSALALAITLSLSACGGGSSSSSTDTGGSTGTTYSTAGVLCALSGNGNTVTNVAANSSLPFQFAWSCTSTQRTLVANGIPNHTVGSFPNANNPNTIATYNASQSTTLSPSVSSVQTVPIIGYALNGVKFDPNTGGACSNSATSSVTVGAGAQCTYIGAGAWSLEAIVPNSPFNFGADSNNAHVQPTGDYHYHGAPTGVYSAMGGSESNGLGNKMQIVGWAADGFPIYYKYGYKTADDASSGLVLLKGNYKPNSSATTMSTRPLASVFPLGTFRNDWAYSATNGGDLDECNGRNGVTPEFPKGTYYYVATESYPYVQRCIKGS
jgi:hypothetical protein